MPGRNPSEDSTAIRGRCMADFAQDGLGPWQEARMVDVSGWEAGTGPRPQQVPSNCLVTTSSAAHPAPPPCSGEGDLLDVP